jgi:hypothetical protein
MRKRCYRRAAGNVTNVAIKTDRNTRPADVHSNARELITGASPAARR